MSGAGTRGPAGQQQGQRRQHDDGQRRAGGPIEEGLVGFSPNKLLNHDTPAERIQQGDFRSVLALIEALADGVVA